MVDTLFLFRKYGLQPDFVSIGKGFPGGLYPASRLLVSGAFDCLSQFGALVTNGQEELASLAYLVTMEFVSHNGAHIEAVGKTYHDALRQLAARLSRRLCSGAEGDGHIGAPVLPSGAGRGGLRRADETASSASTSAPRPTRPTAVPSR